MFSLCDMCAAVLYSFIFFNRVMAVFAVPAANHFPLYIGIMNGSLTQATGLNMDDYFELNSFESVIYSDSQFHSK